MSKTIAVALAQINPIVGDLAGNAEKILYAYGHAVSQGADLVVFPEMAVTGYPIQDLALRGDFVAEVEQINTHIMSAVRIYGGAAGLIFGSCAFDDIGNTFNVAICVDPSREGATVIPKYELPTHGVFDETRTFVRDADALGRTFQFRGHNLGVMICEDVWHPMVTETVAPFADALIVINGSPYETNKVEARIRVVNEQIAQVGLPVVYVNMVGGQDEIVFDGASFVHDANGTRFAPSFEVAVPIMNLELGGTVSPIMMPPSLGSVTARSYAAAVLGLRDYVGKNGFKSVVLGYSGGVDSGLVAAIACDALGPDNVHLVRLPSKFSSEGSLTDAQEGAMRLGAKMRTIHIQPVVDALDTAYWGQQSGPNFYDFRQQQLDGVAAENIQARARGTLLMAISNQEGHMLLTTGNKSECSVGYSTLYGDMCGSFNPIKDLYKTEVWELCRYRNAMLPTQIAQCGFLGRDTIVVPEEIISKPPSAELSPDQRDEDSLGNYYDLDKVLCLHLEEHRIVDEIIAETGLEREYIEKIIALVYRAEFKRKQGAPGVKLSGHSHGGDRRYPVVNGWRR